MVPILIIIIAFLKISKNFKQIIYKFSGNDLDFEKILIDKDFIE